jgi:hypothetical protein
MLDHCTDATTLLAWSETLATWIIIANTCKRWTCRFCGEMKSRQFAQIARSAQPNRLITLTVNPPLYDSPRQAFEKTAPAVAKLTQTIRRHKGPIEYLRVLEVTRKGWPHYHLVARSPYIDQGWLSNEWDKLTHAPIVDIRAIKQSQEVYWYVMKYLGKQRYIEWTNRRVTMTRAFAPAKPPNDRPSLGLLDTKRYCYHPRAYMFHEWPGSTWTQLGPLVYRYDGTPNTKTQKD